MARAVASPVECLERRVLLSVSATTLRPSFLAGSDAAFAITGVGTDETLTVTDSGPVGDAGVGSEKIDEVTDNLTLGTTSNTSIFEAFTSAGLVSLGETSASTTAAGSSQTITTDTPDLIEIPQSLTAGKPVEATTTSTTTEKITVTLPVTVTTSNTSSTTITTTFLLVSNAKHSVTVPAGTFSAYEIKETFVAHSNSTTTDLWYAPGVGEVMAIINVGANQETEELTSYTHRPTGLTASLSGTLTESTVETTPLKGSEKITFTATGGTVEGNASARVLLSPDSDPADSVYTLAESSPDLKLAAGQHRTLGLKLPKTIPATLVPFPDPPKTFVVLIELTDPNGLITTEVTGLTLTVAAPQVDLTGTFVKVPNLVVSGKKFPFTLEITNTSAANVAAVGMLDIYFTESLDATSSASTGISISEGHINLKPGQSRKIVFHNTPVTLPNTDLRATLDPHMVFDNDIDRDNNGFGVTLMVTS